METVTPAGLPPRDAPAPDVTGPDITPAGLPPVDAPDPGAGETVTPAGLPPRPGVGHSLSGATLALTALAGVGLAALIGGGKSRSARRVV